MYAVVAHWLGIPGSTLGTVATPFQDVLFPLHRTLAAAQTVASGLQEQLVPDAVMRYEAEPVADPYPAAVAAWFRRGCRDTRPSTLR